MELLKISDRTYIPTHNITRICNEGYYMYIYCIVGTEEDYAKIVFKDGHTLEQELQSRLINIDSAKGFINAI